MNIAELQQQRNTNIQALHALNELEDFNDDTLKKFDDLEVEIEEFDKRIALSARALKHEATQAKAPIETKVLEPDLVISAPRETKGPGLYFAKMARAIAAGKGNEHVTIAFATKAFGESHPVTKQLLAGSGTGVNLVPEDFAADVIELLRNKTSVRMLGARTIGMPNGNLTLPRQNGATSAAYVPENTAQDIAIASFESLQMSAKKLMSVTAMSNEFLMWNTYNADALVRDDIIQAMSIAEDSQFLRGTGSPTEPTSLLEVITAAGNVIAAAPGASPTNQTVKFELGSMEQALLDSNIPMVNPGWTMAPRTYIFLKNLVDGNGNAAFPEMDGGTLRGFPLVHTNQIPTNLGIGGDESEIYLVDYNEWLIGETGQMMMETTNTGSIQVGGGLVSTFANDLTAIRVISHHDFGARHEQGGAVLSGVQWAA